MTTSNRVSKEAKLRSHDFTREFETAAELAVKVHNQTSYPVTSVEMGVILVPYNFLISLKQFRLKQLSLKLKL